MVRILASGAEDTSSNLVEAAFHAPVDHWLDRRAFNSEKADRNRSGVPCSRRLIGSGYPATNGEICRFDFCRGRDGSGVSTQLGFISPIEWGQHPPEPPTEHHLTEGSRSYKPVM